MKKNSNGLNSTHSMYLKQMDEISEKELLHSNI